MKYRGREIDVVGLWEQWVEFPPNVSLDDQYLPLVVCPNPAHETNKRHFQINQRDGLVHCFARCGISGTFDHAIQMIEGCDAKSARKQILRFQRSGKVKPYKRSNARTDAIPVKESLDYDRFIPQSGIEYLHSRGISEDTIAAWELGWDSTELRIVIPAHDEHGVIRFLIKRATKPSQWPKYLYTEGARKSDLLFGACKVSLGVIRSSGLILVEGSLDALRLNQHGFSNVVATLGTGLSKTQAEIVSNLRPRRIYCYFDKDSAGVAGMEISERNLRGKYPILVVRFPKGRTDPAECTRREVERSITRAIPLRNFKRKVGQAIVH